MESAIVSLDENLRTLKLERKGELKELQEKFGKGKINLNFASGENLKEKLQEQIKTKEDYLRNLINSSKNKLKSKSKGIFSDDKHKERNEKLELFFKNFPSSKEEFIKGLENIKNDLSKKLSEQEINSLCQTRIESTQLQIELKNLQEQQAQIQIPSK